MTRKTAYIGLGSNLGDRIQAINSAIEKLMVLEKTRLINVASLYETSPVGLVGRPFLNAVARIETGLGHLELLDAILSMEKTMGRIRDHDGLEPRIIDLDLLLYGNTVLKEERLILPHPRMLNRRFVMEPLAELAPGLKIPPTGITASEAAARLKENHPEQEVRCIGKLGEVEESLRFDV